MSQMGIWHQPLGRGLRWIGSRLQSNTLSAQEWEKHIAPFIRRYVPQKEAEKYPTLILLHGCAGDFSHLENWASFLAGAGYLVYTIDSLAPRRIGFRQACCMVCTGLRLQGLERSRDITAALAIIREDAKADLTRLSLIGWSHGAWTAMEWLHAQPYPLNKAEKLACLIFIYPYCGLASIIHQRDWPVNVPVLVVTAERDTVVPNRHTLRLVDTLKAKAFSIMHIGMMEVLHGFDLFERKTFHAEKTRDLQKIVLQFLGQTR